MAASTGQRGTCGEGTRAGTRRCLLLGAVNYHDAGTAQQQLAGGTYVCAAPVSGKQPAPPPPPPHLHHPLLPGGGVLQLLRQLLALGRHLGLGRPQLSLKAAHCLTVERSLAQGLRRVCGCQQACVCRGVRVPCC